MKAAAKVKLAAVVAVTLYFAGGKGGHGIGADLAAISPGQVSTGSNVDLGRQMAAGYGWTGQQWDCLNWLWTQESGWSNTAENPKSGAYGIAQALGHGPTNQYPAGPANPPQSDPRAQITWGLGYIKDTYGSPCGAWAHEEAQNWY
jgi:hypothetical protein